jgi:hypothetical protein
MRDCHIVDERVEVSSLGRYANVYAGIGADFLAA